LASQNSPKNKENERYHQDHVEHFGDSQLYP